MQLQQGDVLLRRIDELPKEVKKKNGRTLALGEATGHHHTMREFLQSVILCSKPLTGGPEILMKIGNQKF